MSLREIRILLAEDDPNLGTILRMYLQQKGFLVKLAGDGEYALNLFKEDDIIDICIFDVMMPGMDGFSLAKEIRRLDSHVPIIFLTALNKESDKLKGFELGADDYITKPFSMEELIARINAVLRRTYDERPNTCIFEIGKYVFDYEHRTLTIAGKERRLTSKEAELLRSYCINLNQVVDRQTTLRKIWKDDSYFAARSMDVYITKMRKYLEEDPCVKIVNVHGVGFKLSIENQIDNLG